MKGISKLLRGFETRKLLWTNPNPDASFSTQDIPIPNAYDKYDLIEVEFKLNYAENTTTGMKVFAKAGKRSGGTQTVTQWSSVANAWQLLHRSWWWDGNHTAIHFDSAWYFNLGTSTKAISEANLIPYRIYGIKKIGGGTA